MTCRTSALHHEGCLRLPKSATKLFTETNYFRRKYLNCRFLTYIEAIFDQREWTNLLGHHHGISALSSLHVREAIVLKRVHIYCYLLREKNKVLWNLTLSAFLTFKSRRVMIGPHSLYISAATVVKYFITCITSI